jgi:hypothetical protein
MISVGFLDFLSRVTWWFRNLKSRVISPSNVVRLCRHRTELISIVNEAKVNRPPWKDDLIDLVIQSVLEGGNSSLSVFATTTVNPFDRNHALGVVAEGITQKEFRKSAKNRKSGCTRGTLIIPLSSLTKISRLRFTPWNNLNFFPADHRHFDLSANDTRKLAVTILDGLHDGRINCSFLGNQNGSYQIQAAIAYSYCLAMFGNLVNRKTPLHWRNGKDLSGAEQIEILQYLSNTSKLENLIQ